MEISNNPAYEGNTKNSHLSGDHLYELDVLSAPNKNHNGGNLSGDNLYDHIVLPGSNKNHNEGTTNSRKTCLVIAIILITAVLALAVAMVSVGLSAAFNSKPEIKSLQVSLDQSVNTIEEDLDEQISALQTNTTTQYESINRLQLSLNQAMNTIEDLGRQISALQTATTTQYESINRLQLSLNQSVNAIEDLGKQISALQTATTTQYGFLNQTVGNIQYTIREQSAFLNDLTKGSIITNPATSCSEISTDNPSGEYWIVGNPSPVQVYCDMNRVCCNTIGGWMRVANLDMTDSNQQCPDGFLLHNENTAPLRTCGRPEPPGCMSTTFPVHGIEYSRVCGRVVGYKSNTLDGFGPYYNNLALTIDNLYVDGVSLTHGQSPRKHIWTFAAHASASHCPCTQLANVPPFIGQEYFCDTGRRPWNSQGCGSTCCSFSNPPWFCKELPQPTTDAIELRLCADQATSDEDIFVELVDIFVK